MKFEGVKNLNITNMDSLSNIATGTILENLPKELLEKIVIKAVSMRKHTFHLICTTVDRGVTCLSQEATYKNITISELPLKIMRDQSLGETLFREIIRFEKDDTDGWEEFRKDEILKTFIQQIDADYKWIDNNEIESEYIERIFTKYHPDYNILDTIKDMRGLYTTCGDRNPPDTYGIFCDDDDSYGFIYSLLIFE